MKRSWLGHGSNLTDLNSLDNAVNLTSSHWVVATAKNLTFSNVFVLSIFFQGDTAARALSHFFNISSRTTGEATRQATQTVTVLATSTVTSSATAGAVESTPLAANGDSFGTPAKVGVAVGAAAALGLGVVAGWFFARRNRGVRGQQSEPAMRGSYAGRQASAALGWAVSGGREPAEQEKARVFHEVGASAPARELHGEATRYELYGTSGHGS
jgi:hypothetical protein